MRRDELITKTNKLGKEVFSVADLQRLFPEESNLHSSIKRLKETQVITPVARGLYRQSNHSIDVEKLATQLYYPSYLSFESILSRHGVIDQGSYGLTLATTRHSRKRSLDGIGCEYIRLKPSLFFGFTLINGVYAADAEKALLDELYLATSGKRSLNRSEWNLSGLNKKRLSAYVTKFPPAVKQILIEEQLLS